VGEASVLHIIKNAKRTQNIAFPIQKQRLPKKQSQICVIGEICGSVLDKF
jgi:hypothetical protein